MFTGLIEEMGTVRAMIPTQTGMRLEIAAQQVLTDTKLGDSISVNGCCLTAIEINPSWWAAEAVSETLQRTDLKNLAVGEKVNLERSLQVGSRLGGHLVQGHIDGVGKIESIKLLPDNSYRFLISAPPALLKYMVEKGSIALDGISLTLCHVDVHSFSVTLIPHTIAMTTFGQKKEGLLVNIEVDLMAKYVEKLVLPFHSPTKESLS